jgi:hypothetical protein
MGALRINLTDGTSTFIDLTSATVVSVASSDTQQFVIEVDGNPNTVTRFGTKNPEDGSGFNNTIWEFQMAVAYTAIAADPIRYGYPKLGTDINTYIQYDDEKFLASAIDSALSNIAEPAVLSNRTAIATQVVDSDLAKALIEEIDEAKDACSTEAETEKDACVKAVEDAACSGGYDFGGLTCACGDTACCQATESIYYRNCISSKLDGIIIEWKHQYLFAPSGGEGEKKG